MSSRARSRAVAVVAALPLFVMGGPVLSATAEDGQVAQATMVKTLGDYRVGPRAGFRGDVARGVSGTTAIMKVDLAPSAVVSSVAIRLTADRAFSIYQSFNSNDGFALYKDTDDDGLLDPSEHAAGAVTAPGYTVGAEPGAAVVTLTGVPERATGASQYLLTVHPAENQLPDRKFTFTLAAGSVKTSAGDIPSSSVSVSDVVVDSMPPTLIPASQFTPVSRPPTTFCPPGSAAGACGNDGYKVFRGGTPAEEGAMIGFFNAPGDVSDGALLVASPAVPEVPASGDTPAVPAVPAVPALYALSSIPSSLNDAIELNIGNGTGKDPNVPTSRALNNQITDNVYVSQWDQMGNVISHGAFSNDTCDPAQTQTCPTPLPARGNDVTGPKTSAYTVSMSNINAATSNPASVQVSGRMTGLDSARPAFRTQTAVRQVANLHRLSDQDVSVYPGTQAWSAPTLPNSSTTAVSINSFVDASNNTLYPNGSKVRAIGVLVDDSGNPSAPAQSSVVYKDLVAAKIVSVSLLDLNGNGKPDPDERYRVLFDDVMNTSRVTAANVNTRLNPDNHAGTTACGPTNPESDHPCPYWGDAPAVAWPTTQMLLITLGEPNCPNPNGTIPCPPGTERLALAGDEVQAFLTGADAVQDIAGNPLGNPDGIIEIGNPFVQAIDALTFDKLALTGPSVFNTNRDGVIEGVDVHFSGEIDSSTIAQASDAGQFTVQVPGGEKLTATAASIPGSPTKIRLSFDVPTDEAALWNTASKPTVALTAATLLESKDDQKIPVFSFGANDGAPPVPVSIRTSDTSPGDGKIDKVFVKYSEAVQALAENPCGYTVAGYTSSTYVPAGSGPQSGTCPGGRNQPSTVAGQPDTVALTLVTKTVSDTDARPAVSFSASNQVPAYGPAPTETGTNAPECNPNPSLVEPSTPDCGVLDLSGNALKSFSGVAADTAVPVITARATIDRNSDGHIDAIDATFSEPMSTPSIATAQFAVTEPAYTVHKLSLVPGSDTQIRVELIPSASAAGDTAEKPKLQYLGGATDAADPANAAATDAAGVVVSDKAGPALLNACVAMTVPATVTPQEKAARLGKCPEGPGDKMAVSVSEALDTTTVAPADFVVEQPDSVVKTAATATAVNAADGKSSVVTLTFTGTNVLDPTKDATVRFASAGVVTDNITAPKNPSTQTAEINSFAAPEVGLNFTCPVAANDGYCSANSFNTGATGNSSVTGWRLVESNDVPPAIPAAGDFTGTRPDVYPSSGVLTEGKHQLWLRGKDDMDRMSPEATDTMTVLKAPKIQEFQIFNKGTRPRGSVFSPNSTFLDGDKLEMGAKAYGTDAAEWAANSAPLGGGCLADHMSANFSKLTGRSGDSKVAPFRCDLSPTTVEQKYRQMLFPDVTVAGTTKYPVGTVLKVSSSDPGSMIVDGPSGTQRRRPFISVNARRSWMVSDASVITVPSALVAAIPRTTNLGYRDGAILRSGTSTYYYVASGVKRPVSTSQLAAWRIPTSTAYAPTATELRAIPTGTKVASATHQVGTWIKYSNGQIFQIVRKSNGATVRRQLAAGAALRTRVPSSHVYPALSTDSRLPIDSWLIGYRDGTLVKLSTTTYGVIARGSLRKFANPQTFNTLGYSTSNALAFSGSATSRVKGQTYRIGTAMDRYDITTVVMKVTNKAGASATLTVHPTNNKVWGVGVIDPIPAGWDMTR